MNLKGFNLFGCSHLEKSMKNYKAFLYFFLLFLIACSVKDESKSPIVAKVGSEKITFEDLENSIILNPQYAIRTPLSKVRKSQVNYLVRNQYYFLAAKRTGLENDPALLPKIKYIKDHETIRAYIRLKFLNDIDVSELELIQGVAKLNKLVKLQQIFVSSREEAMKLKAKLDKGEDFEKLANEVNRDESPQTKANEIGYITFGNLDYNLEQAAYSLKVGEISEPILSPYGYHILRVADVKENDAAEHLSSTFRTQKVAEIIRMRKADAAIRSHLKELSEGDRIQINNRVLEVLVNEADAVMDARNDTQSFLKPPIKNQELQKIQVGVTDVLDKTLVRFGDEEMSVGVFLKRLKEMPPYHRPYLRTRNRIIQSIIDMIRNDLLLKEAYNDRINKRIDVQKSYQKEIKTFLADEFQKQVNSRVFKEDHPNEWQKFNIALKEVEEKYPTQVNEDALFYDVQNPDSIYLDAPTPLFLKDRYVW